MAKRKTARRRRSRVSGLNSKDLTGLATSAVIGGGGAVVLKMVLDKVLPAEYSQYSSYAQIVAGLLVASMTSNAMVITAGLGAATVGAANVVSDIADGTTVTGLHLLPPGVPSMRIAGLETDVVTQ